MKKFFIPSLLLTVFVSMKSFALPVIGAATVPSIRFPTLQDALDTLNAFGVAGAGPVTITINADQFPSTPYFLGSDTLNYGIHGTSDPAAPARTLTFNMTGHKITAPAGTGSIDAIFTVQGTDNVTFKNFVLVENALNTTATTMMERGFSIVKRTNMDGAKSISITNCSITLNRTNTTAASGIAPMGATGIYVGNSTALSNAALTTGIDSAVTESIFIFQDTIRNVNQGVFLVGTVVTADGSVPNERNATVMENTIENFDQVGISLSNFNNDLVKGNIINNMASGGVAPTANSIFGIRYSNNITLQTNTTWTCVTNNIKLTINTTGSTYAATGIYSRLYGTGTYTIENDSVELVSTGNSAQLIGIFAQNRMGTQQMNNNVVQNFSTTTTNVQAVVGIHVGGASLFPNFAAANNVYPQKSSVNNNKITNFNACSGPALSAYPNYVAACMDDNMTDSTSNFTNNTVSDFTINNISTKFLGYGGGLTSGSGLKKVTNATGNSFSNITVAGATNTTQVEVINITGPIPALHTSNIINNKISKINGTLGAVVGIFINNGLAATVDKDTISDLTSQGLVSAVYAGNAANGTRTITISNSSISNLSVTSTTGGAGVVGFAILPGTSTFTTKVTINNNLMQGLSNLNATGNTLGININSGTAEYNIFNNILSNIKGAANNTSYCSSFGINLTNPGTNNVYFNTVNMDPSAAPGTGYGSTGLQYNPAGNNTIQNNILRVNVIGGSGTNVAAMRGSSGAALAAPSTIGFNAKSNIYYTPRGASNYLYVEGTTDASLVNGFHDSGLVKNTTKNIVNDTFFNSECDKSSYHKFMFSPTGREKNTFKENNLTGTGGVFAPAGISFAEGTAFDIPAVSADFLAQPRVFGVSDIGAIEFSGLVRPSMDITITSSTGLTEACVYNLPKLNATYPSFFNRVSFQWFRDTTKIPGATTTSVTVSPVTAKYIFKVYDSVTGCTYSSAPFLMTIVPPPPALIAYYDSLTFCETSAVVLNANKGKDYSYRWLRNGSVLAGETNDHLVVDKSGEYNLEVNTPLGCPTTSTSIRVKVYPLPTPTIIYDGPDVLATQKYFTYQWYRNNVKVDSAISRKLYIMRDGAYTVEVTDSNGCTAKSEIYLYSLGVNGSTLANANIRIFPNPAIDRLNIESPVAVTVRVTDLAGKVIMEQKDAKVLEIGHLSEGMYMLNIIDEEGNLIKVQKINKVK